MRTKVLKLSVMIMISLFGVNSYATESVTTSSGTKVYDVTKASTTLSLDPALMQAQDSKSKEIASLQESLAKVKQELERTKSAMGVPITSPKNTNTITQNSEIKLSETSMPAVPADVITKNVPKYSKANAKKTAPILADNNIYVTPGVNQILAISIGHTNRLVTPFSKPQVRSASLTGGEGGEVSIKDNVIYIATAKTSPISVFITDKDNENLAISLTLLPRKIPARDVSLNVRSTDIQLMYKSKKAEVWEKSQPYVSGIASSLKEIALGNLPNGYQLSSIPANYTLPICSAKGFNVDFSKGQLITGSKLHYVVGKVTNVGTKPLEFIEANCGGYDIAAVALWPYNLLKPGQSSEIYIVKHANTATKKAIQKRVSVLDK